MNENIRVSDADRERVAERLREHFAQGRLTSDELEERITATLGAKTVGDLRQVMTDLPGETPLSAPVPPQSGPPQSGPPQSGPPWAGRRGVLVGRRPRILPLLLVALVVAIALPGAGFVLATVVKVLLVAWLVACLVGFVAMARFRRRLRRHWQSGGMSGFDHGGGGEGGQGGGYVSGHHGGQWHHYQWSRCQWNR